MYLVSLVLKLSQAHYFIFDIQQLKPKSLYISPAVSYFHEMWASFGLAGQFSVNEFSSLYEKLF